MDVSQACRFCETPMNKTFIDLGTSPLSNAYLKPADLHQKEVFYPLHVRICSQCFLVQLPEFESPKKIFSDYAYFSSYSDSWLKHCAAYTDMMIERFGMDETWQVVEIASNDGYLLQYFQAKKLQVLGIEPAENVAQVAQAKGIPTWPMFFGEETANKICAERGLANLIIANNVLAHVPNLNDFVAGLKVLLAPLGVMTLEFPHLLRLLAENQFDTIYHEHFSYFSFLTVQQVFAKHGLTIFDVEEVSVHGGSLRIFVKHEADTTKPISSSVQALISREQDQGLHSLPTYDSFAGEIENLKYALLEFIIAAKKAGKKMVGYGAPAKGNTLLNYCGIDKDLLTFTVDRNPHKQAHYLPGTRIPVYHPDEVKVAKPDYLLILPWNLKEEVMEQMAYIKSWGGKFVIPVPRLQVI